MSKLKRGKGTTLAQKQWYVMDRNKDRNTPTGPAYEYSFAMDFSKLVSGDVDLGTDRAANFPRVSNASLYQHTGENALRVGQGILLETEESITTAMGLVGFPYFASGTGTDELHVKSHFTSSSVDGIPDGALSPEYKYLSMVATFNSVNEEGTSTASMNDIGYFTAYARDLKAYGGQHFHGDRASGQDYPRFLNGVSLTEGFDAAARDAQSGLLYAGTTELDKVMTLTWDFTDALAISTGHEMTGPLDIEEIVYQIRHRPLGGSGGAKGSVMIHGFIFSKQVPGAVTLPIHTSRPDAAFA
jgi:hypothetical protein